MIIQQKQTLLITLVGKLKQLQNNESQTNNAIQAQTEKYKIVTAELIALQQQVKQQEETISELKKTVADNDITTTTLHDCKKINDEQQTIETIANDTATTTLHDCKKNQRRTKQLFQ